MLDITNQCSRKVVCTGNITFSSQANELEIGQVYTCTSIRRSDNNHKMIVSLKEFPGKEYDVIMFSETNLVTNRKRDSIPKKTGDSMFDYEVVSNGQLKDMSSSSLDLANTTPRLIYHPSSFTEFKSINPLLKNNEYYFLTEISEIKEQNPAIYLSEFPGIMFDPTWFIEVDDMIHNINTPFTKENLKEIYKNIKTPDIKQFYKLGNVNVYENLEVLEESVPYIISILSETGQGNDKLALSIINPYTLEIEVELLTNIESFSISLEYPCTRDICIGISNFVKNRIPHAVICVQSIGIGNEILNWLVRDPYIRGRVYYEYEYDEFLVRDQYMLPQ